MVVSVRARASQQHHYHHHLALMRNDGHAPWPMNWNTFDRVPMQVVIQERALNRLPTMFPGMTSGLIVNICTNMMTEMVLV